MHHHSHNYISCDIKPNACIITFEFIKHLQNVLAYLHELHHVMLKCFHKCNITYFDCIFSHTILITMVSKLLLLLVNKFSHSRENIILSKKELRTLPFFQLFLHHLGLFSPVELSLRPQCLFLIMSSTNPNQLNVLIYSFNHTQGVYLPFTNYIGFHNFSFNPTTLLHNSGFLG